jgi:hypothetical protein
MMLRRTTALLAVLTFASAPLPAARASARAAAALPVATAGRVVAPDAAPAPFRVVPLRPPRDPRSHLGSYLVMASGAGAVAMSFGWQRRANRSYDEYLAASDPAIITDRFDRTTRYDRLSSAALLGGEALIATGVWMRFLRHPAPRTLSLEMGPRRCALTARF